MVDSYDALELREGFRNWADEECGYDHDDDDDEEEEPEPPAEDGAHAAADDADGDGEHNSERTWFWLRVSRSCGIASIEEVTRRRLFPWHQSGSTTEVDVTTIWRRSAACAASQLDPDEHQYWAASRWLDDEERDQRGLMHSPRIVPYDGMRYGLGIWSDANANHVEENENGPDRIWWGTDHQENGALLARFRMCACWSPAGPVRRALRLL